jgi:hypothetical protein
LVFAGLKWVPHWSPASCSWLSHSDTGSLSNMPTLTIPHAW